MPAREQQTAAPTPEPPLENKSSEMLPIMISEILPVMIADCRLPILSSPHAHAPRRWPVSIKKRGPSPALPVCFFTSLCFAVSKSSLPKTTLIFCKPALAVANIGPEDRISSWSRQAIANGVSSQVRFGPDYQQEARVPRWFSSNLRLYLETDKYVKVALSGLEGGPSV